MQQRGLVGPASVQACCSRCGLAFVLQKVLFLFPVAIRCFFNCVARVASHVSTMFCRAYIRTAPCGRWWEVARLGSGAWCYSMGPVEQEPDAACVPVHKRSILDCFSMSNQRSNRAVHVWLPGPYAVSCQGVGGCFQVLFHIVKKNEKYTYAHSCIGSLEHGHLLPALRRGVLITSRPAPHVGSTCAAAADAGAQQGCLQCVQSSCA